jgi:hypothetical protein
MVGSRRLTAWAMAWPEFLRLTPLPRCLLLFANSRSTECNMCVCVCVRACVRACYRLDKRGQSSNPGRVKSFPFFTLSRRAMGPTQLPSYSVGSNGSIYTWGQENLDLYISSPISLRGIVLESPIFINPITLLFKWWCANTHTKHTESEGPLHTLINISSKHR